jgi:formylmethanofuran dehydrogenase subunit E
VSWKKQASGGLKAHNEGELRSTVENAARFHGHLGPFLVIGVKMGRTAQKTLNTDANRGLLVTAIAPLKTPFSCVLDGIQASTQCTVGNQRLKIIDSPKEISASFQTENSAKTLTLTVNSKIIDELLNKISKGASSEELAWQIARTPEQRLFTVERR